MKKREYGRKRKLHLLDKKGLKRATKLLFWITKNKNMTYEKGKEIIKKIEKLSGRYEMIMWNVFKNIQEDCNRCNSGIYADGSSCGGGCNGCEKMLAFVYKNKEYSINDLCIEAFSPMEWGL